MPNKSYNVFHRASTAVCILLTDNFRSHLWSFSRKLSWRSVEAVTPANVPGNVLTVEPRACTSSSKHMGLDGLVESWVSLFFVFIYVMLFSKIVKSFWKRFMIALLFWCSWLQLPFLRHGPSKWTLWRSELLRGKSLAYSIQPDIFSVFSGRNTMY